MRIDDQNQNKLLKTPIIFVFRLLIAKPPRQVRFNALKREVPVLAKSEASNQAPERRWTFPDKRST